MKIHNIQYFHLCLEIQLDGTQQYLIFIPLIFFYEEGRKQKVTIIRIDVIPSPSMYFFV